jgi:hypothetical protein
MMLFIDPGPVQISLQGTLSGAVNNGTSVTVTGSVVAVVVGGLPPYTYDWTDNVANVSIISSSSSIAKIQVTGTDVLHTGNVILRLHQAGGVITTASSNFTVSQGTP